MANILLYWLSFFVYNQPTMWYHIPMSNNIYNEAMYLTDIPFSEWKNYIGLGYRSVCYTHNEDKEGQIILFGFDLDGNRKTFICPHKSYIKYAVKYKTKEVDIYDRFVETKYFKNSYARKKYIDGANGLIIIEALPPESEFLHKLFDNDVLSDTFNTQTLREQYIDIETEMGDYFMKPSEAGNRINMITILDSETKKYYTWSLTNAEIDFKEEPLCNYPKDDFVFFGFNDNELDLLKHFISWIEDNYPDVSISWNGKGYDWPYIIRRIENVLGKQYASRLSPVGKYKIKDVNHDNARANVEAEIEVDIKGLFIADDLILYRDKFGVRNALDGGYSLNNVGDTEGLGEKIHYDGSLKDLYVKDYQKFYEYNVRDVNLLYKIEKKCKLCPLARIVAGGGLVNYDSIYSSIGYLIGSIISFSKSMMKKTFVSYLGTKKEQVTFEGAYVFPTITGIYNGGIVVVDFHSLYPSLMQAINASPETYKGKIRIYRRNNAGELFEDIEPLDYNSPGEIEKLLFVGPSGMTKEITLEKLIEIINTKCIYTPNNTLFLKHEIKVGVITSWCKYFYNLRATTKDKELEIFHKLHNKKDLAKLSDDEIESHKTKMGNFHIAQIGYKNLINSAYGMFGTAFSPIFNPHIAQSITRLGQKTNRSCSKFIKDTFKDRYGIDDSYQLAVGGDTDSFDGKTKLSITYSENSSIV